MKITEIKGNILEVECEIIAHQVNCIGVMGSGLALQIKNKWPEVFVKYVNSIEILDHNVLGGCLIVDVEGGKKFIANLFGQYFYKNYFKNEETYLKQEFWKMPEMSDSCKAIRFTNYEALYKSITRLKNSMEQAGKEQVAFPKYLGCARGGGSWSVVSSMISEIFKETNIEVLIVDYDKEDTH